MSKKKISEKQLIANRENCKKSTGPKTSEGKEIVSRNATKHGLYARDIIINSPYFKENRAEYETLVQSLYEELSPASDFQEHLVLKIANCFWRSRRAVVAETAIVNGQLDSLDEFYPYNQLQDQLEQIPKLPPDPNIVDDMQERRVAIAKSMTDMVKSKTMLRADHCMKILYYEMRINRQLEHYFRILWKLQGNSKENISNPDLEIPPE